MGTAARAAPQVVTVHYGLPTAPPVITTVTPYFALERGYFKDVGLDVEIVPLPGSVTVVRALLSRQVDVALTDPATAFLAYANGAPIKIISGPVEKGTDSLIAVASVKSIADLRGKRFAIADPGGQQYSQIKLLASKYGLNAEDIQFLAVGGPIPRVQGLLAGRVDATTVTIAILKPVLDAIDQGKLRVVASMGDEFPDIATAYDITRDDVVKNEPTVLSRLALAEMRGLRWAAENPDAAAAIAGKYISGVDPALLVRGEREIRKAYGLNGGVTAETVQGAQRLLVQLGVLRSIVPSNQIFAPQFISLALGSLGYLHH
jgi:NitT/TauT family transport system substrate-binding protein